MITTKNNSTLQHIEIQRPTEVQRRTEMQHFILGALSEMDVKPSSEFINALKKSVPDNSRISVDFIVENPSSISELMLPLAVSSVLQVKDASLEDLAGFIQNCQNIPDTFPKIIGFATESSIK